MEISDFQALLKPVIELISSNTIDAKLNEELNRRFPPDGEVFAAIEKACHKAIAAGLYLNPEHHTTPRSQTGKHWYCTCCRTVKLTLPNHTNKADVKQPVGLMPRL